MYKKGDSVIFAVNDMFTDAELDQMRAPGNSPEPLPELPTLGELGLAETEDEVDQTYYHRPTVPAGVNSEMPSAETLYAPDPTKPHTVPN